MNIDEYIKELGGFIKNTRDEVDKAPNQRESDYKDGVVSGALYGLEILIEIKESIE